MKYILEYSNWVALTGESQQINEDWSLEDWGHLVWDVVDAIADTVVPGSGGVLDFIHAATYFIESMKTQDKSNRLSYGLQGIITLTTVFEIGPLKSAGSMLKNQIKIIFDAVKSGAKPAEVALAKKAASTAVGAINTISGLINQIISAVANLIRKSVNSEVGQWIIKQFPAGIEAAIKWFTTFLTTTIPSMLKDFLTILAKLNSTGVGAAGEEGLEFLIKAGGQAGVKSVGGSYALSSVLPAGNSKEKIQKTTSNTNSMISQLKPATISNTVL